VTTAEWLMIIALVTTLTTIIQCIEMYLLLRSTRNTNEILSNPTIIVKDFLENLVEDKDVQKAFFEFVAVCGSAMMQGMQGNPAGAPAKPVKLKGMAKLLEPFINNQQVQGMIADKIGQTLQKAGTAGAKRAVDNATEAWL